MEFQKISSHLIGLVSHHLKVRIICWRKISGGSTFTILLSHIHIPTGTKNSKSSFEADNIPPPNGQFFFYQQYSGSSCQGNLTSSYGYQTETCFKGYNLLGAVLGSVKFSCSLRKMASRFIKGISNDSHVAVFLSVSSASISLYTSGDCTTTSTNYKLYTTVVPLNQCERSNMFNNVLSQQAMCMNGLTTLKPSVLYRSLCNLFPLVILLTFQPSTVGTVVMPSAAPIQYSLNCTRKDIAFRTPG